MPVPVVNIFGIPFCKLDMQDTVNLLCEKIAAGKPYHVITGNPIMVMQALESPQFMAVMQSADLVVPDGAGVVWAAARFGNPVAERVAGFDLMHRLLEIGNRRNWKVFLLGASAEVIAAAAEQLRGKFPALQIVGARDGYFTERQDEEVIAQIRAAAPHMLFVGRAMNNQDPWIAKHKEKLGVPLMMGIGGSFDVVSGKLKRAPILFQRMRLEWFYRLLQEPARYRRMLVLPKFAWKVIREHEKKQ